MSTETDQIQKELTRLARQGTSSSGKRRRKTRTQQHVEKRSHFAARVFTLVVVGTLAGFIWWASRAELEQQVHGQGSVIPESANQVIQSLEPGIVSELLVKEGEEVKQGQVLLRLHDVQYSARNQENLSKREILKARMVRLQGEANGVKELKFPEDLAKARPDLVVSEQQLFAKRAADLRTMAHFTQEKLIRLRQKLGLMMPAIQSGAMSEVSRIDIENQMLELQGELETTQSGFLREAMEKLDEDRAKLEAVEESIRATEDQLQRATIKAPVDGVVNKLFVDSAGRVVQAAQPIMEIVPAAEGLLIEAKIAPADIGFLKVGLPVKVRFTAYDFTIYGGLEGTVETLAADTVDGPQNEVFYPVKIRTPERSLGKDGITGQRLDLRPGMVAEVGILTGRRTVMDYLLNPIHRARRLALRER